MRYTALVLLLAFLPAFVHATNWYVDGAAAASGSGTSWAGAWRNFASIDWGSIMPGDTVYISGGVSSKTYNESWIVGASGTAVNPITFAIDASNPSHNGTVIFDYNSDGDTSTRVGIAASRNYITFNGNVNSQSHIQINNLRNINDRTPAIGIYADSVTGITIDHMTFINDNNPLRINYATGTTIRDSSFQHVRGDAAIALLASSGSWDANKIYNNYIEVAFNNAQPPGAAYPYSGPDGIQGGSGISIYNNTFKVITTSAYTSDQHPDMMQITGNFIKAYGNEIINIGDSGFDYDPVYAGNPNPHDVWIYNNIFRIVTNIDPYPEYIRIYSSGGAITSLTNFKIFNNVFADNTIWSPVRINGFNGNPTASGNEIKNNIFYNVGKGDQWFANIFIENSSGFTSNSFGFDGNIYYNPGNTPHIVYGGVDYTAANWINANEPRGKTAAPSFVSYTAFAANNDFHLVQSDTAAKDSGVDLSGYFSADKEGIARPQGAAWDIGAFEFSPGGAENIYISQNLAGADTGTNCASAHSASWLNTAANWGAGTGKISAGDTVRLCGTFTFPARTTGLTVQASGTSGNPITIRFEPGAILQSPSFANGGAGSGGAINMANKNFIIIDGGTDGIIQNTDSGTGRAYNAASKGIDAAGCNNCEIKNLNIQNIYVRTSTTDSSFDHTALECAKFSGSNWLIHDNTFHDAGWCLNNFWSNGDTNVRIYNNNIYNVDHGWTPAGTSGSANNLYFYNNHVHDFAIWDDTTGANNYHHDGIHAFGATGAKMTELWIYNNLFDGDIGQFATGYIFLEGGTCGGCTPWTDGTGVAHIFNNIFVANNRTTYGVVQVHRGNGVQFFNNYVSGSGGSTCVDMDSITGLSMQNNIITSCNILAYIHGTTVGTVNNNIYSNSGSNAFVFNSNFIGFGNFAGWKSACNCDSNAQTTASLVLDSGMHPLTGSPVINAGANLYSLGVIELNSDKSGLSRPSAGAWEAGAYEFSGGSGDTTPPTVSITSPTGGTVSGMVIISANANDDIGVAGVQFKIDGANAGAEDTTSPYSMQFDTATLTNDAHTISATARDAAGNTASSSVTVTVSNIGNLSIIFMEAESGTITAPFTITPTYISQDVQTTVPSTGGRAAYTFNVQQPGDYVIKTVVNAPGDASNSLFINMDAEPTDPTMVWDIPITTGFQERNSSWRGSGTFDNNEFVPKIFTLSTGQHTLIIRGREANTQIDLISIIKVSSGYSGIILRGRIMRSAGVACPACVVNFTMNGVNGIATTASDGTFMTVLTTTFAPGTYNSDIIITDGATVKSFKKRITIV